MIPIAMLLQFIKFVMQFLNHSIGKIKSSGGRITKTKLAVLEVLEKLEKPSNPYEIAEAVRQAGGRIDVVTVYRILESFEQLELVHKSEKGYVPCTHFSCSDGGHCHHQFFCDSCERAIEVHINDGEFMNMIKLKFADLQIKSHDFRFSGLCNKCQ